MKVPNPSRWAGVCAGGYFAGAAVYLGNIVVLAVFREGELLLSLAIGAFLAACLVLGLLVLSGRPWAPRLAVVAASGFTAVHLIGLAYLFFVAPSSGSVLARSLQWQIGTGFLFLWLCVLGSAFRLVRVSESPGPAGG